MKIAFALFSFFVLSSSALAQTTPELRQAEVAKNLSQFIRSNASHYWSYMKAKSSEPELQTFIKYQGFVAGDPHMGNFAPLPLRSKNGTRKMRFVNVDFDDAGYGPFVLDFARYVTTVEATVPKIKKKDLEDAYIIGLKGQSIKAPSEIQEFLDLSPDEYDELAADYVRKHSNAKGFILEAGKIEADNKAIPRNTLAAVFPSMKLIDVAIRPRERGGSEGIRVWTLVEEAKGQRHIIELKPWEPSGLSQYQTQPPLAQWLESIYDTFWPQFITEDYELIEIQNVGFFWKRPKKFSLIDELKDEFKTANQLAIYDANLLGLAHSGQKQSKAYLTAIVQDPKAFHKTVESIVDDYLSFAKKAFEELKK